MDLHILEDEKVEVADLCKDVRWPLLGSMIMGLDWFLQLGA